MQRRGSLSRASERITGEERREVGKGEREREKVAEKVRQSVNGRGRH